MWTKFAILGPKLKDGKRDVLGTVNLQSEDSYDDQGKKTPAIANAVSQLKAMSGHDTPFQVMHHGETIDPPRLLPAPVAAPAVPAVEIAEAA